jgi:hypothetical protein
MPAEDDSPEPWSTPLPPPEAEVRGRQPAHLATTATAAALARVGQALLTALSPRPWYRRVLRHEADLGQRADQDRH